MAGCVCLFKMRSLCSRARYNYSFPSKYNTQIREMQTVFRVFHIHPPLYHRSETFSRNSSQEQRASRFCMEGHRSLFLNRTEALFCGLFLSFFFFSEAGIAAIFLNLVLSKILFVKTANTPAVLKSSPPPLFLWHNFLIPQNDVIMVFLPCRPMFFRFRSWFLPET